MSLTDILDPVNHIGIIVVNGDLLQACGGTPWRQIFDGRLLLVTDSATDSILLFHLKPMMTFIAEVISNIGCKAGLCIINDEHTRHHL